MIAESESAPPFNRKFLAQLRALIDTHHTLYPHIPPTGSYFDSLVEQALKRAGWPAEQVIANAANAAKSDLLVGDVRVLLRTETGTGAHPQLITISRLCSIETETWDSPSLIQRALEFLARCDQLLMLRALWGPAVIHYQLLDVPLDLLRRMTSVTLAPVRKRAGRPSLAAEVWEQDEKLFRVHFDGAGGRCQVSGLPLQRCRALLIWDQGVN